KVGVWRVFMLPSNFVESALPSAQPLSGRWHVSHDIFPVFERRVSKNSFFPSSAFSAVIGLSAGTAISPSGPGAGFGAAACAAGFSGSFEHDAMNTNDANTRNVTYLMSGFLENRNFVVRALG